MESVKHSLQYPPVLTWPVFRPQEVSESQIDASSAYMLFYERADLSHARYMPNVDGKAPDTRDLDDDLDSDLRKVCTLA